MLYDSDDAHVYSLGYCVPVDGEEEMKTYYIDKDLDSKKLVLGCIIDMVRKYDKYVFYCHNFGRYDTIFLLKLLIEYNEAAVATGYEEPLILEPFSKDNGVLCLDIKMKVENKKVDKIRIQDSIQLLPSAQKQLAKAFDVQAQKGAFPHKFAKPDTLFYVGNTPDYEFYEDGISKEVYDSIKSKT